MPKESNSKIEVILQAAQQRLGLLGYEKTTMREIADDIAMSKASLYYYFPDKEGIFKAVIEKEQEAFFLKVEEIIAVQVNPEDMLTSYIRMRVEYFREFMNLSKFRSSEYEQVKPILKQLFDNFRSKELNFLTQIINLGQDSGRFHCENAEQMAELFLDIVKGLRFTLIKQRPYMELSVKELELLEDALQNFTRLFIKGLKYNEKKLTKK